MFLNDFTSNNGFRVSKKDLAEILSNAEIRAFTVPAKGLFHMRCLKGGQVRITY